MAVAWYDAVHSAKRFRLGTKKRAMGGNEYIYLAGVTSLGVRDVVSFNTTGYIAVRLAADAVGQVALASSVAVPTTATTYGWFLIWGFGSANSDTVAAAGGLFIDGTTGRVDDASVAGDFVNGMVSTGADATNVLPVQLQYPYVTNTVPA